jgi:hypothetical protein
MAKIQITSYDGAETKIERLGLKPLLDELEHLITSFEILVAEERQANSAAVVRERLDERFRNAGGWQQRKTGDVDWKKCKTVNGTRVCIGVEIQVSGRDVYRDILHLKNRIVSGDIDIGVIVVSSDRLQQFLTDRTPDASYTKTVISEQDANRLPILLIEMEHDGPGPRLEKKITNRGKRR